MVTVSYTSIIATDVDALCAFYGELLGLEEIGGSTPIFRGLATGNGVILGFSAPAVYGLLGIEAYREPTGSRQFVTFAVDDDAAVDATVERALAMGATLLHPAYSTSYGSYQAVLADPESNIFRVDHAATPWVSPA